MKFPQNLDVFQFTANGKKYLLDINTSAFFEIDKIASEIIAKASNMKRSELIAYLQSKYKPEEIEEAFRELERLKSLGLLRSLEEAPPVPYQPYRRSYVNSISLNITHDCNLRCKYCYGGAGNYGGPRDYMSLGTAQKAIDFLMENSGQYQNLSINFFGGEPLLNMDVLKYVVLYGNDRANRYNKKIDYVVTTNATLLSDEVINYLNDYKIGVQISLDGPPEVQDLLRPFPHGKGSYKLISKFTKKLIASRNGRGSVRATLNHYNTDLVSLAEHFLDMGFTHLHFEPVSASPEVDYALTPQDLRQLENEYQRFINFYMQKIRAGKHFGFESFHNTMSETYLSSKRQYYCGAGRTYIAIDPRGDIYPCHRFQGMPEWKMGDIFTGINYNIQSIFMQSVVERALKCQKCWARYLCGGGCYHENYIYNKKINRPYAKHCFIRKLQYKAGLQLYASIYEEDRRILDNLFEPLLVSYRL